MKRSLFLLLFFCCAQAMAQNALSIHVAAGYSFPIPNNNLGENSSFVYSKDTDPETGYYVPSYLNRKSLVKGSYASGFTISLGLGYSLNNYVSFDLTSSYTDGKQFRMIDSEQEIIDGTIENSSLDRFSPKSKVLLIAPALVLTVPHKTLQPYVSTGVVFGVVQLKNSFVSDSDFKLSIHHTEQNEKFYGGVSMGLRGAIGVNYALRPQLSLFTEVAFTSMNFSPKHKKVTHDITDGTDNLPTLNERQRHTIYVDRMNTDSRVTLENPEDSPSEALRVTFPMSNMLAKAGIKLFL